MRPIERVGIDKCKDPSKIKINDDDVNNEDEDNCFFH